MDPTTLSSQISSLDQGYNPTQTYNDITTKLGIPDARTRVQALQSNLLDTQNAIKAVDPSVAARTANSLVTEAQRGALVNMEKAPLTDKFIAQNQEFGTQNGQLQDLLGQANTQAGLAQTDYQNKRQGLADQLKTAQDQQAAAEAKAESDRQFAENQRQFNITSSQKAATPAVTPAQLKLQVSQHIANQLAGSVGRDGKVSNETWAAALNDFTSAGGTTRQFWQNYGQYVNDKYMGSYAGFKAR